MWKWSQVVHELTKKIVATKSTLPVWTQRALTFGQGADIVRSVEWMRALPLPR